jgi:hypothetical protein
MHHDAPPGPPDSSPIALAEQTGRNDQAATGTRAGGVLGNQ